MPASFEDFLSAVRHTMTTVGGLGMGTAGGDSNQFYVALAITAFGYLWSYAKNRKGA